MTVGDFCQRVSRVNGAEAGSQWAEERWHLSRYLLERLENDGAAPEAPGRLSFSKIRYIGGHFSADGGATEVPEEVGQSGTGDKRHLGKKDGCGHGRALSH